MCLSIAVDRPGDVLATGKHAGHEWSIIHNTRGYRCGYVKVEVGHPWYGKDWSDLESVEVHGGLTFASADVPCGGDGPDSGWWLGFDCAHVPTVAMIPIRNSPAQRRTSTAMRSAGWACRSYRRFWTCRTTFARSPETWSPVSAHRITSKRNAGHCANRLQLHWFLHTSPVDMASQAGYPAPESCMDAQENAGPRDWYIGRAQPSQGCETGSTSAEQPTE